MGVAPVWAQSTAPVEGEQYVTLAKPVDLGTPAGKVEVLEFFWYSCPHCNAFEPMFDKWKRAQPADVIVRRVPVAFQQNGNFVPQQKLYYALESMNLLDKLHTAVFNAVHNERKRLTSDDAVFDWIKTQGVDVEEFKKTYNSFSVASSVRRASQLQDDYRVEGVPSLGVAGKYYTDGPKARNLANALQVVEYLIEQERKAAGK
ncbi:thiol:disulfide interchange protein DsbA/DsbL [Lampropedia puyangensis]|uniref:Thiol:disulfide interchange protein n=1 Tax=Lampropedia puyangensis TaxID=1330072 RepID=A0A4S8F879_9BURK|nr:thiol:disulfide interchange protein DsbA/DsbL [Lampropedia puyangensis]THU01562.1 thiol:disulfide interchange protein DsbA/DsbL [Lampropedia puyangensis]